MLLNSACSVSRLLDWHGPAPGASCTRLHPSVLRDQTTRLTRTSSTSQADHP